MQDQNQAQVQSVQNQTDTTANPADSPAQQTGQIDEPEIISGKIEQEPIDTPIQTQNKSTEIPAPEIDIKEPSEIVIPNELNKIIEKGPDAMAPKIEKEVQNANVTLAKESTPMVITTPGGKITLPETYASARQKERVTDISDSDHWYAALLMYLWSKYDPDAVKEAKHNLK